MIQMVGHLDPLRPKFAAMLGEWFLVVGGWMRRQISIQKSGFSLRIPLTPLLSNARYRCC
jgi:hypothetical protein